MDDTHQNAQQTSPAGISHVTTDTFEEEVLKHDGVVFVDFYADWCGPCKMTEPIIEELAHDEAYKDVKFVQIDVDSSQDLAVQYSIFSIPTFMLFKKGQVAGQFSGARDKAGFEKELEGVRSS